MLGKFFECEADKKINFNAEQQIDMGGFCVSTFDYIFRWLIRGDTLCEVIIPENEKYIKDLVESCKNIDYFMPVSQMLTDFYGTYSGVEYYSKKK